MSIELGAHFVSRFFLARFLEGAAPFDASGGSSCVPPVAANDPTPTLENGALLGYPEVLGLRGDRVYWATQTEILSAPIAGGAPPAVVAHGQKAIADMVVDERAVYWATRGLEEIGPGNDGAIFMQSFQGGAPVVLADHLDAPHALAVDGTQVYWTGGVPKEGVDPPPGFVMSISVDGGAPVRCGFANADGR